MTRFVGGCLTFVLALAILGAAGAYYLYRSARPAVEEHAAEVADGAASLRELSALNREIEDRSEHTPPTSGELTEEQVARFARVQARVRRALGERAAEIEQRYRDLSGRGDDPEAVLREALSALADTGRLVVLARRFQVQALNEEDFSQSEYSWVRTRVYQAAGVELASGLDLGTLEDWAPEGDWNARFSAPDVPLPEVPQKNRELVQAYRDRFTEWLPMAFFGL